jgi:hypothetical protein
MAIIKNAELWYTKLDPKRPNARFDKNNPSWEAQIRTTSKEQKKEWEELGLRVSAVIPDEDDAKPFYKVNLRKRKYRADGTEGEAPDVVDGNLQPVDPNTIGNGSIGNIRIYQYESKQDSTKLVSVLMRIQLVKHIVYQHSEPNDEFEQIETEVVHVEPQEGSEEGTTTEQPTAPPRAPATQRSDKAF